MYLNMENIHTWRPVKKFENKWAGPFDILEQVGSHAYCLDLPGDLKQIHNVFHVDRLKPYYPDPFKRIQSPPPPIHVAGDLEHSVEAILDSQPIKGEPQHIEYLVKWEGYGAEHNSWVPHEGMVGSLQELKRWHREHPRKRRPTAEQLRWLEREAGSDERRAEVENEWRNQG